MTFKIIRPFIALLFLLPVVAEANDFEAALSSETAQFTFHSDSSLIGWGGAELGLGVFYNDDSDFVGQLSIMQRRQASQDMPLTLGVGVNTYLGMLDDDEQDIFAVAISGEVRYTFPGVMPMSLYFTGHYAPKITSFSDAEEILDTNLGFQIEVLPQTIAFVGLRSFKVDANNGKSHDMDDDRLHIGVRLTF
ncbi:MAG: hypothetical protein GY744_09825 [Gammaproteobacteria bacterium]|nr:hypothetical protein [Gammaproteobacteria bacterium]